MHAFTPESAREAWAAEPHQNKAVQPELEWMTKSCHLQSGAANRTAPWHVPQPSNRCSPSLPELHLWSPLGSACICCTVFVASPSLCLLPTHKPALGTPAHHLALCQWYQDTSLELLPLVNPLFELMKKGFHQLSQQEAESCICLTISLA